MAVAGRRHTDSTVLGTMLKVLVLGSVNALAVWSALVLVGAHEYWLAAVLAIGCGLIDYMFLARKAYPWRYLAPGLFFMAIMVVYPILYTVTVSFTNFGTGHVLTKAQAIDYYSTRYTLRDDLPEYDAAIYRSEDDKFVVLLESAAGDHLVGHGGVAKPLAESDLPVEYNGGPPQAIGRFEKVGTFEIFQYLGTLQSLEYHMGEYVLKMRSAGKFSSYSPEYHYDETLDALISAEDGTIYRAIGGSFVSDSGETLDTGYRATVGWDNFARLVRSPQISGPFVKVFTWTFEWAALSVLTTFALGLLLAVLLNDPVLKLRGIYRVLLIVPYAVPAFISALVWRGLFNTEVGPINDIIQFLFRTRIPWLQDPFWAKVALITVNLWLGFPYMMIVSLGSLQSIPGELYEAARVDGASGWEQFWKITMPLLLVSVAPLLVASFAFNFNNFSVIYLVTKGRPAIPGARTPAGATDILITYTYRLAFEGASGTDYGLASAITILIFIIVAVLSWANFRFTGALEEVRENA